MAPWEVVRSTAASRSRASTRSGCCPCRSNDTFCPPRLAVLFLQDHVLPAGLMRAAQCCLVVRFREAAQTSGMEAVWKR